MAHIHNHARTSSWFLSESKYVNESSVYPKSTSNQSSKPCTVLQYPSKKINKKKITRAHRRCHDLSYLKHIWKQICPLQTCMLNLWNIGADKCCSVLQCVTVCCSVLQVLASDRYSEHSKREYHEPHKDSCDWQDWGLTLEALPPRGGASAECPKKDKRRVRRESREQKHTEHTNQSE